MKKGTKRNSFKFLIVLLKNLTKKTSHTEQEYHSILEYILQYIQYILPLANLQMRKSLRSLKNNSNSFWILRELIYQKQLSSYHFMLYHMFLIQKIIQASRIYFWWTGYKISRRKLDRMQMRWIKVKTSILFSLEFLQVICINLRLERMMQAQLEAL